MEERLNALTTADKPFVWWVRSIDDLVLRKHGATRHYVLSDAMGNVTAIVSTAVSPLEKPVTTGPMTVLVCQPLPLCAPPRSSSR